MRRSLVMVGVVVASLSASIGLSSAGAPPTLAVTPNPVAAGADVTITNTPNEASTCVGAGGGDLTEGNAATVSVSITPVTPVTPVTPGGIGSIGAGATPDADGNWQVVVQIPDPGEYEVLAVCNGGGGGALTDRAPERVAPFTYQTVNLVITEANPLPDPIDLPPVAVPDPQPLQPAFTG